MVFRPKVNLITPSQLRGAARPWRALDASWHMPGSPVSGAENYAKERIPSARFFDLDAIASPHPLGLKHMLPTPELFATSVSKLGINRDDHVVVYDTHGIFSSPRGAFTFAAFGHENLSVLDGGLPRWKAEGHDIEHGAPKLIETTAYPTPPEPSPAVTKTYEEMVANYEKNGKDFAIVLDARAKPRYTGEAPEPRPGLSSGHIPRSLSLPFSTLVQDGTLLSASELESKFTTLLGKSTYAAAKDGEVSIVASCGSGMTAGVIWLALQQVGVEATVYDESWTGYAMRPESKIAKGEA